MPHHNHEIHCKVLRHLAGHPDVTQRGSEQKPQITLRFLRQPAQDYEQIKRELVELEAEVNGQVVDSKRGDSN